MHPKPPQTPFQTTDNVATDVHVREMLGKGLVHLQKPLISLMVWERDGELLIDKIDTAAFFMADNRVSPANSSLFQ